MADIGPITAKVVATSAGMASGLSEAEKKLKASTSKMAADAKKDGAAAGKGFASALTQGLVIAGGMKLFDLGAAGLRTVVDLFTGGAARMAEVGKAARQAGADVAGFQVIVEALGNDLPTAVEGVVKLKEAMGKALVEGQTDAFDRLGLDAAELMGMRDDKAFAAVADRLQRLGGGVAEARAGVALFGDKFKDLRHVLDDGGERIAKTAAQLEKFGAAFGEGDFLASRKWRDAVDEFSLLWKGLQNEIGKGLLPIVTTLSDRIGSLADSGITFKGLGAQVINAAEQIAKAGAVAVAVWSDAEKIKTAWEVATGSVKAAALTLGADLFDALTGAWDRSVEYLKKNAASLSWESLKAPFKPALWAADLAGAAGSWLFGGGAAAPPQQAEAKWSDGLRAEAERLAAGAAGKANTLAEALKGDKLLRGIKEMFGDIRDAADQMQTAVGRADDPFALWAESADRLSKSLEGPIDKFKETLKQVGAMQAMGRRMSETLAWAGFDVDPFDDGTGGAADRARGKAFTDLQAAFSRPAAYNPAAAMLADSREAYSTIQAFRQSSTRESVEEALKRILQQQLEQEREQLRVGKEVAAAAKKLANNLVPRGID